ncbi:hypothetical protein MLD38_006144 [Melastoma candidum]|uniref:Uncharacterized protein n=1 Tax=Melastoma candidum TaxID=119954 RepID=A0ACB9RLL9_9MYRT|nr:hypothetical protein MLD38_006144 [Melastoma candidum]
MEAGGTVLQASVHLRHIIPLDFDSLDYAPQSDTPHVSGGVESEDAEHSLPTIDLDSPLAEELLVRACESWGMFIVTNHGIPSDVFKGVEEDALRFFSLPKGGKMKALRAPGGTVGYGMAPLAAILEKFLWHEGFTMIGSPVEQAKQVWPRDYMRFCVTMEEYQKRMKTLSEKILGLILKNYGGLPSFHECGGPSGVLQLNSYPECPCPNEMIGLAPHTDTSFITIVHQNNVSGLQLFHEQHGWISVAPMTGSLVVNVGDMLHIMSNARFLNALHRATVSRMGHRLSFAYFCGPPADFEVSPVVKTCCSSGPDQEARYRPVTKREYKGMKNRDLNALSLIKITQRHESGYKC